MSACCRRHMMGRSRFAPAVYKLTAGNRKLRAHIRITKGKDRSGLIFALRYDKLEIAVFVLRNRQIRNRSHRRIELCQIATAYFSVEHLYGLHRRLVRQGDVRIAGAGMTDDTDILVEINGIHLGELSHAGDRL